MKSEALTLALSLSVVFSIAIFFLHKRRAKKEDDFIRGYNEMVNAFKSGNINQIKYLKAKSTLLEPKVYTAYKACLARGYKDCTDPNVTTPRNN